MREGTGQRGSIAAEVGLAIPVIVMLILGAVHFGSALSARHQLGDATSYATRLAAMNGESNPSVIESSIEARLGASSPCSDVKVVQAEVLLGDEPGVDLLDVIAECRLEAPWRSGFLADFAPLESVSYRVAMPLFAPLE